MQVLLSSLRQQTAGTDQQELLLLALLALALLSVLQLLGPLLQEPQKLASWWSYRAADFRQSNRGLRLDHILVTPGLREAAFRLGSAAARRFKNAAS